MADIDLSKLEEMFGGSSKQNPRACSWMVSDDEMYTSEELSETEGEE